MLTVAALAIAATVWLVFGSSSMGLLGTWLVRYGLCSVDGGPVRWGNFLRFIALFFRARNDAFCFPICAYVVLKSTLHNAVQ